jgi:hypothetical protein
MTIQFEKLKARLLANPEVKAEYDALVADLSNSARAETPPPQPSPASAGEGAHRRRR